MNAAGPRYPHIVLILATFVLVLTSLPARWGRATIILELYRARWQVELAFKRLKQLLAAGHVPKTTNASSRAWRQAKILTALLIEIPATAEKVWRAIQAGRLAA